MVTEHEAEHPSRWAAVSSIAAKIGCSAQTLNEWLKKAEVDNGKGAGLPSDVAEKMKALERENRELRQANEILRMASTYFAQAPCPSTEAMISFIDAHRSVLGSSRSTDCRRLPCPPIMKVEIRRVFNENFQVYGVRKVWRQLPREGATSPAALSLGL